MRDTNSGPLSPPRTVGFVSTLNLCARRSEPEVEKHRANVPDAHVVFSSSSPSEFPPAINARTEQTGRGGRESHRRQTLRA